MERITIFDTTLRDGEQSPGASMSMEQKYELAAQLSRLGVDVIETGFPVSSPHQFEASRLIAQKVKGPTIAALARALEKDLDAAAEAIEAAARAPPHPHLPRHLPHPHAVQAASKKPDEVVEMAVQAVRYARRTVDEVEFSPEDGSRSELALPLPR